eukprot:scaffold25896_cov228-Skeletonema_marinoi.AAC.3
MATKEYDVFCICTYSSHSQKNYDHVRVVPVRRQGSSQGIHEWAGTPTGAGGSMREPRRPHFKCKKLSSNIGYITRGHGTASLELPLANETKHWAKYFRSSFVVTERD